MNTDHLTELQRYLGIRTVTRRPIPRIHCADGFSMSVQAGESLYCSPRSDTGPWEEVEVGFPSQVEPLLFEYAEDRGQWTDTVYPYVPIALVASVIELHGGRQDKPTES